MPARSVTFQVTVLRALTPVRLLAPGAIRWKLSDLVRSLTLMLYLPAVSCLTRAPDVVFSEIVRLGPTCATSFVGGGGVVTMPAVKEPRIESGCVSQKKR